MKLAWVYVIIGMIGIFFVLSLLSIFDKACKDTVGYPGCFGLPRYVKASTSGRVLKVVEKDSKQSMKSVIIEDRDTSKFVYLYVDRALVEEGKFVKKGEIIGVANLTFPLRRKM